MLIFIFVQHSSLIKFQENFLRTPLIHGITKSLKNDLFKKRQKILHVVSRSLQNS